MNQAAKVISVIFHPLLMTTYLFIIISVYLPDWFQPIQPSVSFVFLIFGLTFVLPALNFLFFRMSGAIRDLYMPNLYDRRLPFVFISILYCLVTLMFYWKFPLPNVLRLLAVVSALVVLGTVISFFYKVSIHSISAGGAIGILLPLIEIEAALLVPTSGVILIAGLVMSSRLLLNAHTPFQVFLGGMGGFLLGFLGITFLF